MIPSISSPLNNRPGRLHLALALRRESIQRTQTATTKDRGLLILRDGTILCTQEELSLPLVIVSSNPVLGRQSSIREGSRCYSVSESKKNEQDTRTFPEKLSAD